VQEQEIGQKRAARTRRRERGEGKLKALITTAIILMGIVAAVKIVPAYVANYQLIDKMQEQARFGVVNGYSADQLRDTIYKEVQDLGIPADKDDIKVMASSQVVKISLDYTVPIDLYVYKTQLHFTPEAENKNII
jgi:hypothetical protein